MSRQEYTSVRLPTHVVEITKQRADAAMRSIPKQIEFELRLARAAADNPDLPIDFIAGCLEGMDEVDAGLATPFEFIR